MESDGAWRDGGWTLMVCGEMVGGKLWWVESDGGWRVMVSGECWWVESAGGWRVIVGGHLWCVERWWVESYGWRCGG